MANRRVARKFSTSSSSSMEDNDDDDDKKKLDIPDVSSVDQGRDNNSRTTDEPICSTGPDVPRREENPFSFKHFLSKDARTNYNMTGARPKIYSPIRNPVEKSRTSVSDTDPVYSRNPTELPDFVQDHLVLEQCYLSDETPTIPETGVVDVASAVDSPDFMNFTLDNNPQCRTPGRRGDEKLKISGDLPFDLTGGLERPRIVRGKRGDGANINAGCSKYSSFGTRPDRLDIRSFDVVGTTSNVDGLPFDLPPPVAGTAASRTSSDEKRTILQNCTSNETNVNKSLPDFLNDGPIRNRVGGTSVNESTSSLDNFTSERLDPNLLVENERLRDELNIARRQIAEGTRMIESLQSELISRRKVDREETAHLEKAMEQVEANLKQSTKRAKGAENAVMFMKQQVKTLTAEVAMLRSENRQLLSGSGSTASDYRTPTSERKLKKLSDELRAAATTAEGSLRQLMSGVNNLKVLASAIENVDRIEDRTKDFLHDFDEDNAAGPAL